MDKIHLEENYQEVLKNLNLARENNRKYGESFYNNDQNRHYYKMKADKLEETYRCYKSAIDFISDSLEDLTEAECSVYYERIINILQKFHLSDIYNLCFVAGKENIKMFYQLVGNCVLMKNREEFYHFQIPKKHMIILDGIIQTTLMAFGECYYYNDMRKFLRLGDCQEVIIHKFYEEFFRERIRLYGTSEKKASFYTFFYRVWKKRRSNIFREDCFNMEGKVEKKAEEKDKKNSEREQETQRKKTKLMIKEVQYDESTLHAQRPINDEDFTDYITEESYSTELFFVVVGVNIVKMYEHICDEPKLSQEKNGQFSKKFYFKLFHTEKICIGIKVEQIISLGGFYYEKILFETLDNLFLSYCMKEECGNLLDIYSTRFKDEIKIVNQNDKNRGRTRKRFEAKVFMGYLMNQFAKEVDDKVITKKRRSYEEFLESKTKNAFEDWNGFLRGDKVSE